MFLFGQKFTFSRGLPQMFPAIDWLNVSLKYTFNTSFKFHCGVNNSGRKNRKRGARIHINGRAVPVEGCSHTTNFSLHESSLYWQPFILSMFPIQNQTWNCKSLLSYFIYSRDLHISLLVMAPSSIFTLEDKHCTSGEPQGYKICSTEAKYCISDVIYPTKRRYHRLIHHGNGSCFHSF